MTKVIKYMCDNCQHIYEGYEVMTFHIEGVEFHFCCEKCKLIQFKILIKDAERKNYDDNQIQKL